MFGIVGCPSCHRQRVADLSSNNTRCPFCGTSVRTKELKVRFAHDDANVVRDVFQGKSEVPFSMSGQVSDPMKALAYKVSRCKNVSERMMIIANGLYELKGEFTEEDVEALVPGKGRRYLDAMLDDCIVHEVRHGRYTV